MRINNTIQDTQKFVDIPDFFKDKINIHFMCHLTDDEVYAFYHILKSCEKSLICENRSSNTITKCVIIFTETESITLTENEDDCYACYFRVIIYHMNRLRKLNNFLKLALGLTEELVHHFWNEDNEELVKHKDVEILHRLNNIYSIELLKEWKVNGL